MKTYTKEDIGDEQIATLKGMMGSMSIESLNVSVQITDVRRRFGHIDVLVQPLNGTGEQWVEKHRVKVAK
jgi:hypothetical protein